jgi:hypothetical protein
MEEKVFTKIMVEIKGGVMVNITDLPKDQYERFLEMMHDLRIIYIALQSDSRNQTKKRIKP